MMHVTRYMRWIVVPVLAVVSLMSIIGSDAAAQQMGGMDEGMSTMTVMLPMQTGMGTEMMSVTLTLPSRMMESLRMSPQPSVRHIPGVGYEIDYGGPSILIQRFGDE